MSKSDKLKCKFRLKVSHYTRVLEVKEFKARNHAQQYFDTHYRPSFLYRCEIEKVGGNK